MNHLALATLLPALLCAASPALAQDFVFGGFARNIYSDTPIPDSAPSPREAVGLITAGPLEVTLESTTLDEVTKAFGGEVRETGQAGDHVLWVCYAAPDHTVWFGSSGEMSDGAVAMVAASTEKALPEWGCAPAPQQLGVPNLGLPSLGGSIANVKRLLGEAPGTGDLVYMRITPEPANPDTQQQQVITFSQDGGRISGMGVSQVTSN
ncbi:MAG TPA: hypothetical protein VGM83_15000 [Devosiaceae bacterium]|jgi:hypothetical protein